MGFHGRMRCLAESKKTAAILALTAGDHSSIDNSRILESQFVSNTLATHRKQKGLWDGFASWKRDDDRSLRISEEMDGFPESHSLHSPILLIENKWVLGISGLGCQLECRMHMGWHRDGSVLWSTLCFRGSWWKSRNRLDCSLKAPWVFLLIPTIMKGALRL